MHANRPGAPDMARDHRFAPTALLSRRVGVNTCPSSRNHPNCTRENLVQAGMCVSRDLRQQCDCASLPIVIGLLMSQCCSCMLLARAVLY